MSKNGHDLIRKKQIKMKISGNSRALAPENPVALDLELTITLRLLLLRLLLRILRSRRTCRTRRHLRRHRE